MQLLWGLLKSPLRQGWGGKRLCDFDGGFWKVLYSLRLRGRSVRGSGTFMEIIVI